MNEVSKVYVSAAIFRVMEAFGMICQKAGIYTIVAIDDEYKYWNLAEVNGKWLE